MISKKVLDTITESFFASGGSEIHVCILKNKHLQFNIYLMFI